MEHIDDDCARFDISFVKVSDTEKALSFGVQSTPGLLYFEKRIPSVYDGPLSDKDALLEWLVEQRTTDTIEEVTGEILSMLVESEEYVLVFFSGPCEAGDPCDEMLQGGLKKVDARAADMGVMLVTTEEREWARQYDVRGFPSLGEFGKFS